MKKRYKDLSPRTDAVRKPFNRSVASLIGIAISVVWIGAAQIQYSNMKAHSSSQIGSSLHFQRSNSDVVLQNIYTDKKKDVLIARLKLSESAQSNLPFKGTDYKVLVSSNATKGLKEISILFGKMSTDGDMFLILPKPAANEVYTFFIVNEKYVAGLESNGVETDSKADTTSNNIKSVTNSDAELDKSIAATLSAYDLNKDQSKATAVRSDNFDAISFRLALKPGLNNDKYKPYVLDADLLKKNDGQLTFDFKSFFNEVFKKTALETLEKQYSQLKAKEKIIRKQISEAEDKLKINELDTKASKDLEDAKQNLAQITDKKNETANTLSTYESLEYSSDLFANLQTKAKVYKAKK